MSLLCMTKWAIPPKTLPYHGYTLQMWDIAQIPVCTVGSGWLWVKYKVEDPFTKTYLNLNEAWQTAWRKMFLSFKEMPTAWPLSKPECWPSVVLSWFVKTEITRQLCLQDFLRVLDATHALSVFWHDSSDLTLYWTSNQVEQIWCGGKNETNCASVVGLDKYNRLFGY